MELIVIAAGALAAARHACFDSLGYGCWWLRSNGRPSQHPYDMKTAAYVSADQIEEVGCVVIGFGSIKSGYRDMQCNEMNGDIGVRPAIRVMYSNDNN